VYSTAGGPRLIDLVRHFEERHPECEVQISDMAWEDTLGPLQRGHSRLADLREPR
jgi:hypothetical protein